MNLGKMYICDPRELPFLREQAKMILALADSASRGASVREDDDFGFMAMQFLYKQLQHAEALLMLEPRRDAGLIARTMIDGLYQLLWTTHDPETRARRWRSFSIIHDWRLIQGRLKENISVEEAIIKQNELALKRFGHIHLLQNPKPGAADPYHRRWSGVTLSDMANVVGREMYDGPYSELSDWEHWASPASASPSRVKMITLLWIAIRSAGRCLPFSLYLCVSSKRCKWWMFSSH